MRDQSLSVHTSLSFAMRGTKPRGSNRLVSRRGVVISYINKGYMQFGREAWAATGKTKLV